MQAVWVEIPAQDVERALAFYRTVFSLPEITIADDGDRKTATIFPGSPEGQPGISLNQTANFTPSATGVYVYFQVGPEDDNPLDRAEAAGGAVIQGQTSMGDAGSYATLRDTEGNHIGVYFAP
jgi:predicted enzyme related to lactoylglutathione lyase